MRLIGFSTGALAYSDFRRALEILAKRRIPAVELSALRLVELEPLVRALDELDLSGFDYVSFHAPSRAPAADEEHIVELLLNVTSRRWPVIVHPDAIHEASQWRRLGRLLCVENMDRRKPGRTAAELDPVFRALPEASFCFDIGHARQVDGTMREARRLLERFGKRLRQVHLSDVDDVNKHRPLSVDAIPAFRECADLIPETIPVILESPVAEEQALSEIELAREALPVVAAPVALR